ncbi:hypothetical protein RFN57_22875 [Streptomyces violaceochromogenes]|uniref:Uncharacterized protein n=1 Tax=Streptomyces violaceochromogenes TaxID=67377 RepID=A0ABU6M116_9ACTN|nr:hypothetical protein [Streptomyces violaceochromogenes]MEC7055103.1 hypothetical protein [Streptomyces violaceochromogenes]GHC71386.1 hypothetical protein GCM10010309_39530 [Streptomyces violaceochromogenes]
MTADEPRLLPRSGPEGKHSYLITDHHGGPVSRLADATELMQLHGGNQLVDHAIALLPDEPPGDLRYLAERLTEALRDAPRIAESRGRRLKHSDQSWAAAVHP